MSEITIHRLLEKDPATRTGNCSVCGLVAISRSGRGFMCGEKKKAAQKAWREKNPEKSRADRRRKSDHELFNRDYVKNTASCIQCGPVAMTPWGRGNTCANRAAELRTVQETKAQEACRECWLIDGDKVYPVAGKCPRCSDARLYDTGAQLRDQEAYREDREVPPGFVVWDLETFDAEFDDRQPAVPGWKTIGSERPWNEV